MCACDIYNLQTCIAACRDGGSWGAGCTPRFLQNRRQPCGPGQHTYYSWNPLFILEKSVFFILTFSFDDWEALEKLEITKCNGNFPNKLRSQILVVVPTQIFRPCAISGHVLCTWYLRKFFFNTSSWKLCLARMYRLPTLLIQ